jgi:hypothetical protein
MLRTMPFVVFGQAASGAAHGEALVFRPNGKGGAAFVARFKIEE